MSKETFEQFTNLTKLATGIARRTSEYYTDTIKDLMSITDRQLRDLSEIKKPEELFSLQARAANEIGAEWLKNLYGTQKLMSENFADWSKWMEGCNIQTAKHSAEKRKETA